MAFHSLDLIPKLCNLVYHTASLFEEQPSLHGTDAGLTEVTIPFRFLDLAPELRNLVYHFASLSEEQTVSSMRYQHDIFLHGTDSGLTKVCRQIRAEYLPIQRREAVVAFRWDRIKFMQAWFDTFHPTGPDSSGGPRVVRLLWGNKKEVPPRRQRCFGCIFHSATCLDMIGDLHELLRIRAHWTSIHFEVTLTDSYRKSGEPDPSLMVQAERDCHNLSLLLQYDNPTWLTAIREDVFDRIIIYHDSRHAPSKIFLNVGEFERDASIQGICGMKADLEAFCGMQIKLWWYNPISRA